jgi:hypothetical protein
MVNDVDNPVAIPSGLQSPAKISLFVELALRDEHRSAYLMGSEPPH